MVFKFWREANESRVPHPVTSHPLGVEGKEDTHRCREIDEHEGKRIPAWDARQAEDSEPMLAEDWF